MNSTKALYWAGGILVAAAAVASPMLAPKLVDLWRGAQVAPSAVAVHGAASPSASPVSMVAPPKPATGAQPAQASAKTAATSGPVSPEAAGPSPARTTAAAEPETAASPAKPAAATAGAPIKPASERPGFDVVRVEPTGETVVAGHSAPNAAVELRDEGRVIAEIVADDSGQFVILPPKLSEGGHRLELAARSGGAPALVSEEVAVEVAAQKPPEPRPAAPQEKAPVAAPTPQAVAAHAPPQEKALPAAPAPQAVAAPARPILSAPAANDSAHVYVGMIESTASGQLLVKGSAEANAIVWLYLNGAFLAEASAGQDRQWSLTIEHGMSPGLYVVRADEIDRSSGAVLARAEVPFFYPQRPSATQGSLAQAAPAPGAASAPSPTPVATPTPVIAAGKAAETAGAPPVAAATQSPIQQSATQSEPAPTGAPTPEPSKSAASETPARSGTPTKPPNPQPSATPPANVVVSDVRTTTVVRGDNLWDLARRFYGDGTRFRQIYTANASQIRDPRLIYIGQIFVVPKEPPP